MQSFFYKKKFPHTLQWGEETICFIFISFSISKSFIPNFCGKNYDLSIKTTKPVFKIIQYGFEIFQPVLSLNWKIIQLKH